MNGKAELHIDWATYNAAKYACINWHYSGSLPSGPTVKIGAWENNQFIGVVMYGIGAGQSTNGTKYGLKRTGEVAELVRIALRNHMTPVSRIMAISQRLLVKSNPKLRLLVSFSDMEQNHYGGVYQANGWIYTGTVKIKHIENKFFIVHGRKTHGRTLGSKYGIGGQSLKWLRANVDPNARVAKAFDKHRYIKPLDKEIAKRLEYLSKPYPKREKQAMAATSGTATG